MKKDLSSDQISLYNKDGYLILKEFCSKREVDNLLDLILPILLEIALG